MPDAVPSNTITIREARPGDAPGIALVYNQGIADRLATLETEERTPDERLTWLAARDVRHPVLVAEAEGRIVGWGSLQGARPAGRPVGGHDSHGEAPLGRPSCGR